MFNLNIYPIHIRDGKFEKTLPGFFVLNPPRKCARGRESDQIMGLLHLIGQTSITPEALQDWLVKKASQFYKVPGTVTSAMRIVAEGINSELLDRNVKKAHDGSQLNGSLCLVAIHRNILYHLVVGPARLFALSGQEAYEYSDNENHPRGLGVNENVLCRFGQTEIADKDAILFAPQMNHAWSVNSLRGGASLTIDALSRRLFNQVPQNLQGTLVRLSPGNGQISYQVLRFVEGPAEPQPVQRESDKSTNDVTSNIRTAVETPRELPIFEPSKVVVDEGTSNSSEQTIPSSQQEVIDEPEIDDTESIQLPLPNTPQIQRRNHIQKDEAEPPVTSQEIKAQVGNYAKAVDEFQSKTKTRFAKFLLKLIPGSGSDSPALPRSVKIITAIAVPIIVVALASFMYLHKGKGQQFDQYFLQGQQYAVQAESLRDDPPSRLVSLQQALYYLEKASKYGDTDESRVLRLQIQKELDSMEGIVRINMTSINSVGMTGKASITRMAANSTDLYMLDEVSGKALRYFLSGSEYVQDTEFDCGPNPENPLSTIGKLVDIVTLPMESSFNATLFAIDAKGNIEFCKPGESGTIGALIPPDAGWQNIRAISIFQNYLYILDPGGNAVYRYREVDNTYGEKPTLFFDSVIPPLSAAIDIEVNNDELYILRSTGEMVECTYSHMKDYKLTECEDPAAYGDMRTGQSPQAITFPNAQFLQMTMTAAPDSSIYVLDGAGGNLYHFSLQRNLQKILHPGFIDEGLTPVNAPTAVTVSPAKMVFLAYGGQVFYAPLQ